MSVVLEIERIFPPGFFDSANKKDRVISSSESFGKAILVSFLGINEDLIRRGDDLKNEPDFVTDKKMGFEITFANNRDENGNTILRQKKGNYHLPNIENEIIKSFSDSINEKSKKIKNGNYSNVDKVSLIIFNFDPYLLWYGVFFNLPSKDDKSFFGQLFSIQMENILRKRDDFFESIYNENIANSLFDNIFLVQLTERKTYILFDLKKFHNNTDDCMTEIGTTNLDSIPYCIVKKMFSDNDETIGIIYKIHNILMELP